MPLDRPIPAFYCCYLLRSTVSKSSVYVGSTPNPGKPSLPYKTRNSAKHYSKATPSTQWHRERRSCAHESAELEALGNGGCCYGVSEPYCCVAVRVSTIFCHVYILNYPPCILRKPWDTVHELSVSTVHANFHRWAWQNPHITLHIPPSSRIQHSTSKKRSGHPKRPRHTITSLLSNLHLLLRVPSFVRWPLELRFFNEDVYKSWVRWCKSAAEPLQDTITITLDFPPAGLVSGEEGEESPKSKKRKISHGIVGLDVAYEGEKEHVQKAKEIIDFEREGSCALCHASLEHDAGIYTICPNPACQSVTHMRCLSKHFLQDSDALLPVKGTCPSCKAELRWIDIVRELSLRMRGQKEVENLLKVKRVRKTKAGSASQPAIESDIEEDADDDEVEDEELDKLSELDPGTGKEIGDTWHAVDDSEDSDAGSVMSGGGEGRNEGAWKASGGMLPVVIEDSDWDDAELIE